MLPTQLKMKRGLLHITSHAWALAIAFFFLLYGNLAFCQQIISGVVRSEDNLPVVAATIAIRNSNRAVMSDADGRFSISAKPGDVLEISFTGFKTQQIKIDTETVLKITLQTALISLDEVVLTGYTSQKIKEITGSVAIVRPKDLKAVPAGQVEQMLQGKVAGLNIITSGEPGSPSNVRLHGIGNFGDVTPLYIIDGVEGNINSVNPYDIESMQVLKDAGAYSIYGVRGANGVILITTKKGKSGQTKISYDFYVGTVRPPKNRFNLLNPQENANLLWIASKNSGQVGSNGNPDHPLYGNGPTPVLPDFLFAGPDVGLFANDPRTNPDSFNIDPSAGPIYEIVAFNKSGTNWFNELFNPALKENHTITISGGSDKHQYLFSMGYLDEQGTYLNTYLKRYTARINTEFTLLNTIRIGENLQLEYSQNPRTGNSIGAIIFTDPYLPVKDIKGNWSSNSNEFAGPVGNPFAGNPVALRMASKDDKDNNWQIFGNAYGEVDLFKRFTFRTNFGGPLNFYSSYNYLYGTYAPPPNGVNSSFSERSGHSRAYTWTNTMTYSATFRNDHRIQILAGTETKDNYNREQGGTRMGYFTNDPSYRFLSSGNPAGQRNYSLAGISHLSSFISQADYGYKEKYFVHGVLRRDGSSIFGPVNRFGWFPAIGVAWRLTEENFMKSIEWLTDLKLRGSWGKTGFFGNTDPFNQYTLYGGGPAAAYYDIFGTSNTIQPGIRVLRIGNPKTGWQEDEVTNVGFESIFWNGKLSLTADYYNKKSKGLLFPATLPAILGGVIPPNVNVGNVRNKGVDLLVGSKGKLSKNWNWDLMATFTSYNNKIMKLNELPFFDDLDLGSLRPVIRNEVGYPVSSFYGYKIIGFFQDANDVSKSPVQAAAAPGRFKYADLNGRDTATGKLTGKPDGFITEADRVHFGNPNPKFTLGLNIGINYKGFDFSIFLYGSFGNDVLNALRYETDIVSQNPSPKSKTALYDSWTPDHKNARAPVLENEWNFSNAAVVNSYILEKGTYLRNKTMILGYAFPKNWLQKIKIERLRIYLQAVNFFTITNYRGLDPELSGRSSAYGVDLGNYPSQKQYLVGLNLGF